MESDNAAELATADQTSVQIASDWILMTQIGLKGLKIILDD